MANTLHFLGNGLVPTRSGGGFYQRSRAGVRARPVGIVATWVDPFHERVYRQWSEAAWPGNYDALFLRYAGPPGQAPDNFTPHYLNYRYWVVVTLAKHEPVTASFNNINFPFRWGPWFTDVGISTAIRWLQGGIPSRFVSGHRNWRNPFLKCYGQCNTAFARGFALATQDQGIVRGGGYSIGSAHDGFGTGDHFCEFTFIAPAGVTPTAWLDAPEGLIERQEVQRYFTAEIFCSINRRLKPGGSLVYETGYRPDIMVAEDWGDGWVPGSAINWAPLNSEPPTLDEVAPVWAWKLKAWVKEIVVAAVYPIHFRTSTHGVACIGGYAAIETQTAIDTWFPSNDFPPDQAYP